MDGHPLASIPQLTLHEGVNRDEIQPLKIVEDFLSTLERYVKDAKATNISELLIDDCWWRDLLGLSWDITTKQGLESIAEYLKISISGLKQLKAVKSGGLAATLVDVGGIIWVLGGFIFENIHGSGRGLVRLANVGTSRWKAWTVFTQLERLKNQDELDRQKTLPDQTRLATAIKKNETHDLQVLVVGAGTLSNPDTLWSLPLTSPLGNPGWRWELSSRTWA
jgi:hypothetical protein